MFKKFFIFIFFASAYTILLAHNFTPHIHHSEQQTHQHQHQHQDGSHHHHNDNDEEQDEENTSSPFHSLQHTGGTAIEFIPGQSVQIKIQNIAFVHAIINFSDFALKQLDKPLLLLPASRKQYLPLPQTIPYFFQLKAPPAFSA